MIDVPATIPPERAASKIAALRNLQAGAAAADFADEPRLLELLWFIQWASVQPGGLVKFTGDLLAAFPGHLGTAAMRRLGKTTEPYTPAERSEVIQSFPRYWDGQFGSVNKPTEADLICCAILNRFDVEMGRDDTDRPNLAFISRQNHAEFAEFTRQFYQTDLASQLIRWATEPARPFPQPFYFHDLRGALIAAMDAHAARVRQQIAPTVITAAIIDALEFAAAEVAMVEITGDSRFGKTEAVKNYCLAHPGKFRLIKTPCTSDDRSFFDALAEGFGAAIPYEASLRDVKTKVVHILKNAGIVIVMDEAHFLLPQRFTSKTNPARLNYIRSLALDNGCPVALINTPQFFGPAAMKFETATGFNMAQWNGRLMRRIQLPNELPEIDLLAVVKIHFPTLRDTYARRIVAAALMSESYLFGVESIARNTRATAKKHGRATIELSDLETGIALAGIIIPSMATASTAAIKSPPAVSRSNVRALSPAVSSTASRSNGLSITPRRGESNTTLTPA